MYTCLARRTDSQPSPPLDTEGRGEAVSSELAGKQGQCWKGVESVRMKDGLQGQRHLRDPERTGLKHSPALFPTAQPMGPFSWVQLLSDLQMAQTPAEGSKLPTVVLSTGSLDCHVK